MPFVTRRIRIDAPPDVVRRQIIDPDRRRGWLDPDGRPTTDPVEESDGTIRWSHDGDGDVRIDVAPDGDGSHVTVTEEVAHLVPLDVVRRDVASPETDVPVLLAA